MSFGLGFGFPRQRPGAVGWTPAQLSTALWLDAADAGTITLNGSTVSQWNDKSGNGRNATQSTAANQPYWGKGRNLLLRSQSFDDVIWAKGATSVTVNSISAPDGTISATRFIADSSFNQHFLTQPISLSSGQHALSLFVKYTGHRYIQLRFGAAFIAGGLGYANFDLLGAVVGTVGAGLTSASIVTDANGWLRIVIVGTVSAATASVGAWLVDSLTASSAPTVSIPSAEVGIFGFQLNPGSAADTYQQTESIAFPVATGINGRPALDFNGTSHVLNLVNGSIPTDDNNYSIFVVMRWKAVTNSIVIGRVGGAAGSGSACYLGVIGGNIMGNWWSGTGISLDIPVANTDALYDVVYNNTTSEITGVKNGAVVEVFLTPYDRKSYADQQSIGANLLSSNLYMNALFAETIVVHGALSGSNRQRVEGYLAWKWGMQGSLPVNHPYKNAPPTV